MCGITAGVSASDVTGTLLAGLVMKLEYRGYDSAGLASAERPWQRSSANDRRVEWQRCKEKVASDKEDGR